MKIKTAELTGAALDWAVAMCEGWQGTIATDNTGSYPWLIKDGRYKNPKLYRPSTNWAQGGPIIERECMDILCLAGGDDGWQADKYLHTEKVEGYGTTPLEAAMRCYVASKMGDEVEIPEGV